VKLKMRLKELLGACVPLELHLATPEEFEHWYKRFIDVYEEFLTALCFCIADYPILSHYYSTE